jgi:hypothetical protein
MLVVVMPAVVLTVMVVVVAEAAAVVVVVVAAAVVVLLLPPVWLLVLRRRRQRRQRRRRLPDVCSGCGDGAAVGTFMGDMCGRSAKGVLQGVLHCRRLKRGTRTGRWRSAALRFSLWRRPPVAGWGDLLLVLVLPLPPQHR